MKYTFMKKELRGFTLIELLVVIAIIGLLSTIIAAPIQNARKKARDSKKIAEIKAVQLALDQYAEANAGEYSLGLGYLSPTYMPLLPSFASTTLISVADKDKFAYAPYQVSGSGVTTGGIVFGYHLGVHLEVFSQGLDNDRDCVGAENTATFNTYFGTSTCAFYPSNLADIRSFYVASSSGATSYLANNWKNGMITRKDLTSITGLQAGAAGTPGTNYDDFGGSDGDTQKCNATSDCLFDVTGQQ